MTFVAQIIADDQLWYHGRTVKAQKFDLQFVGKGHDAEGPGFYFSKKKEDAEAYTGGTGIVMTVKLNTRKLVPLDKPAKKAEISKMIKAAPELEDKLSDWAEDPVKAFNMALTLISDKKSAKDAFESVWYDFYRDQPAVYLKNMVDLLGYDGNFAERTGHHIVIYNPDVIEVVSVED